MKMKKLLLIIAVIGIAFNGLSYTYPEHVLFGNFARTILSEDITAIETDFSVVTVTNFPTIATTNQYYYLVCLRGTDNAKEIIKVTSVDTTNKVLTVVRAQESTTAITFSTNDRVELWITASGLNDRYSEGKGYTDAEVTEASVITTSNITDYAVTTAKLATNAVTSIKIADGTIVAGDIADGAVITAKLPDNAVTTAKILDDNVTTDKIADSNVTKAKIVNVANYKVLGNVSGVSAAPAEVGILDEDDMSSNSATNLVTQQSVKAYVDAHGVVQVVNIQDGVHRNNVALTATTRDNDIPQIGEGALAMTLAITPTSATNKLKIDVVAMMSAAGTYYVASLFQDATAGALACGVDEVDANDLVGVTFTHYMTAGTTSETTFTVRISSNSTDAALNGVDAGSFYGGTLASSITITEFEQ